MLSIAACNADAQGPDGPRAPTTITLINQRRINGASVATELVAFQDGDGPWQVVAGSAGVYTMQVTQPRYGVVTACDDRTANNRAYLTLRYAAVHEGNVRFAEDCKVADDPRVHVSGALHGLDATDDVDIGDGGRGTGYRTDATDWAMDAVSGPATLLAVRQIDGRAVGLLRQQVTLADNLVIDLDFANQVTPAENALALDPALSSPFVTTFYTSAAGDSYGIDRAFTAVPTYRAMPLNLVEAGISGIAVAVADAGSTRQAVHYFKAPVAQAVTLPAPYRPSSIDIDPPTSHLAMSLPVQPGALSYDVYYAWSLAMGPITRTGVSWMVHYSTGWVGEATSIEAQVPDLSGLAGWDPRWSTVATEGEVLVRGWGASVQTGPETALPGMFGYDARGRIANRMKDGDETTSSSASGVF